MIMGFLLEKNKLSYRLKMREFNFFQGECWGFSTAQRRIRQALERQHVDIVYEADTELQHLSPHLYKKKCKKSFINPPYEANDIPSYLIDKMNEADEVIAVCEHNKNVFLNAGLKKPISVCNQGIDLEVFKYNEHPRKDKLKFLWLGQTSIRKGWDIVTEAFDKAFNDMKDVSLYIKTSGKSKKELLKIRDNVTFDSRDLSQADILDLYKDHHIFVFPSRGEGTGLPVLEAMASGLICLATPTHGMKDFVTPETAIPLEYEMIPANYGVATTAPNVKLDDLIDKMRYCYNFYNDIAGHSKEVRSFIETNFDINKLAGKMVKILFKKE